MVTLTNFLLLLILSILATYTFMNWKGIDKGPKLIIVAQFIGWTILFFLIVIILELFGFISEV